MRCSASLEELSAYLDGELDQARMAAVEAHLCVCESCRRELAELRGLTRVLGTSEDLDPGSGVRVRVARRLAMTEDTPEFTCARMQASMSAMLDSELSPEESRRLESHLATCPACTAELMLLEKISDRVRTIPEVEVPFGLERRIRAAIAREEQGIFPWRLLEGFFRPRLAPGMATALAGATLAIGFWLGRLAPGGPALAPVAHTPSATTAVVSGTATPQPARVAAAAPAPAPKSARVLRSASRERVAPVTSRKRTTARPVVAVRSKPAPSRPTVTPRAVSATRAPVPVEAPPTFMPAPPVIGAPRPIAELPAPVIETPTPKPPAAATPAPAPEASDPAPRPARVEVASQPAPEERASVMLPPITVPEQPLTGRERRARWWRKAGDDAALAAESLRGGASNRAMTARIMSLPF